MNKVKIAVQNGLTEVESLLRTEGYDVHKYGYAGLDADVTIITGIDSAYEEIEHAQNHRNGSKNMLVIDATTLGTNEILKQVHSYYCLNC